MKITSHSIADTEAFAKKFLDVLKNNPLHEVGTGARVVGLYGDLGSGKTTFTQMIARLLGIIEIVTSPTYVIEKIYLVNSLQTACKQLIHIDAYRLQKSEELIQLGWDELITHQTNLIFVEWPEKIADILPSDHIRLKFTFIDETTREIEVLAPNDTMVTI